MISSVQKSLLKILISLVLAGITFAAYAGVVHCSFITLDDRNYIVENPPVQHGFSWKSVEWAFAGVHAGYWIPLTWLSHMLDCQLYGLNPSGHHFTNLIFHVANTVLLFLVLEKLTAKVWPSVFVALLFGIHPMHVESVAWAAELKDVLSAFFFLLTLMAYTRYAELGLQCAPSRKEGAGNKSVAAVQTAPRLHWLYYALALFFFALGLMSKSMLITLPFVLLLLDFWPLRRFETAGGINQSLLTSAATETSGGKNPARLAVGQANPNLIGARSRDAATQEGKPFQRFNISTFQRLLKEKLPFFLLAIISSYLTFLASRIVGAVKPASEFSLADRLGHVPVAYVWYIFKFFWPTNLTVLYVLHKGTESGLEIAGALLLLAAITLFALALVRRYPYFLFGWLWFLGILVPVIGFVQAGNQAYADRFAYLPYIGLSIMGAWGIPEMVGTIRPASRAVPAMLFAGAVLVAVACFVRTIREVGYWKDGPTLFNRMLALDPKNEMAWAVLGSEYEIKGDSDKALVCIRHSLALNSRYNLAWEYLGSLLARKKDFAGAENAYQTALPLMWFKGDRIDTYNRLGDALALEGKYAQAIDAYQSSIALDPGQPEMQTKLGQAFLKNQEPDQAGAAFQAAVDLQPDNPDALTGLGIVSESSGLNSEAIANYRKSLKAEPDSVIALNNLAWLLASASDPALRNGPEAVSLAEKACQLSNYQKAFVIGTLAAAYAQAGRFDDAVAAARKAHDVALANGEKDLAERNSKLLHLYKSHQTYRADASQFDK